MKKIVDIRSHVPSHWVGDGFPVRSMFSYHEGTAFDPFLLLDYAGPYRFDPTASQRGVGAHPHRGFETVTIIYQGEVEHRDSAGNHGAIGPGDVQWMTAASGVVHEEFHSARFAREGGTFEVVQLWVNLPAQYKLSPPRYQEIRAQQIPVVSLPANAGTARVIAGEFEGTRGPAKTFTPLQVCDLRLKAGKHCTLQLPENHTAILLLRGGSARLNASAAVEELALVQFERADTEIEIEAQDDVAALLLSGQPIGEPIVGQGPFVMNTREEIRQAVSDFSTGKWQA